MRRLAPFPEPSASSFGMFVVLLHMVVNMKGSPLIAATALFKPFLEFLFQQRSLVLDLETPLGPRCIACVARCLDSANTLGCFSWG